MVSLVSHVTVLTEMPLISQMPVAFLMSLVSHVLVVSEVPVYHCKNIIIKITNVFVSMFARMQIIIQLVLQDVMTA